MRVPSSGLRIDSPSWPLLQAGIAYWGITDGLGAGTGLTLVCADLDNHPRYVGNKIKILVGGAWGQDHLILAHAAGGILTVDQPFTNAVPAVQQIAAGTLFVILSSTDGAPSGGINYGGALAFLGYCAVGMAASTNVMNCPNLAGLPDQTFTRGYQMIVLRNFNNVANPPEMEMRAITNFAGGLFATAAFSANVEENDVLLIIHNSVAAQISAYGIADAGSGVGIVRDAARTEADDWWNGQTVMMLSGAARGQKRPIADFVAATDDIIPTPNFDAAVGAGDLYVILAHYNMIVPRLADDPANALASDTIGRKDSTPIYTPDNVSDIIRYLKGILNTVHSGQTPFSSLYEGWQDEAGLDANIWAWTNPLTGAAWSRGAAGAHLRAISSPNASETCRLVSKQRWVGNLNADTLTAMVAKKLLLEFQMRLTGVANMTVVSTIWGLTPNVDDTRNSDNIIGFCLIAGALRTLSDDAMAEETNTGFGENLTIWNKLKIELDRVNSRIRFYLNEVLIATHTVRLPDFPYYLNFFTQTGAGGAATIEIAMLNVRYEDF